MAARVNSVPVALSICRFSNLPALPKAPLFTRPPYLEAYWYRGIGDKHTRLLLLNACRWKELDISSKILQLLKYVGSFHQDFSRGVYIISQLAHGPRNVEVNIAVVGNIF